MINCKYIGKFGSNAHPYLVGTSGQCTEETAELILKYFEVKNNLKDTANGKEYHKNNCNCNKCLDLHSFGNRIVLYKSDGDEEQYRVHIKHLVLTND